MSSDREELLLLQMARKAKLSSPVFVMHLQINLHKQAHPGKHAGKFIYDLLI